MEFPGLAAEHPTLTSTSIGLIELLRGWREELRPAPAGSVWMQHIEFAERTRDLADHLRGTLLLADSGLFSSALPLARTALEHHLLDRLILLADRYEETVRSPERALIDQWEREFAERTLKWTLDVASITRTRDDRGLKLLRVGHKVVDGEGVVVEQISPYWVAFEHFDPFVGHPDLQAATARPFSSVDDLEQWARRNQALYAAFLKWSSICWNLQLSSLVTPADLTRLQVHYAFLSAFAHGTSSHREVSANGRPGGPPIAHVLGELALLYVISIAIAEVNSWSSFVERRPGILSPLDPVIAQRVADAAAVVEYFWFLGGSPQPFDHYQEANRRAHPELLRGQRPTFTPDKIPGAEVGYYSNPIDRLSRMHTGENEMATGFGFAPTWSTLHW